VAHDLSLVVPLLEANRAFLFDGGTLLLAEVPHAVTDFVVTSKSGSGSAQPAAGVTQCLDRLSKAGFFRPALNHRPTETGRQPCLQEAYLLLTDRCNLQCAYCFNDTANTERLTHMTPATMRAAVDFLVLYAHAQRGMRIVLWGGEPLVDEDLLKLTLDYARAVFSRAGKPLVFATTTNATRLSPRIASLLVGAGVVVNFSLDGTPESHNQFRVFRGGQPSFDAAAAGVRNYLDIQRRDAPTAVPRARMTITHQTARNLFDNYVALWNLGIPYVWAKDIDWQHSESSTLLQDDDYSILEAEYGRIRRYIYGQLETDRAPAIYRQLAADLGRIHRREIHVGTCGAGLGNVSITTGGDVVACYHLSDRPPFHLGHVATPSTFRTLDGAVRGAVDDSQICRACEYKYLCGGGCMAKGVAHGLTPLCCWAGQCRFIKLFQDHLLRLYAYLSASHHRTTLTHLFAQGRTGQASRPNNIGGVA
jgi:uncharacterized protein